MFLTRDEVLNFPAECYTSIGAISNAIWGKYSCGISNETAIKIITDYYKINKVTI